MNGSKKKRDFVCEFCRVSGIPASQPFSEILLKIMTDKGKAADRNYSDSHEAVWRLHQVKQTSQGVCGILIKIRREGDATYASLEEDVLADVQLQPGQFLAEWFTFLYVEEYNVLVCQRNRSAGSYLRFAAYVRHHSGVNALQINAVARKEELLRLNGFREVTKAVLSYEVPTSDGLFGLFNKDDVNGHTLSDFTRIGREYHGTTITITISQGRSRMPLLAERVKGMMTLAVDALTNVGMARVYGKGSTVSAEPFVDLLAGKLTWEDQIEFIGTKPVADDYYRALEKGYERRKDELAKQFRV